VGDGTQTVHARRALVEANSSLGCRVFGGVGIIPSGYCRTRNFAVNDELTKWRGR
jgi:hypothetical protein